MINHGQARGYDSESLAAGCVASPLATTFCYFNTLTIER